MIQVENLTKSYGSKILFENISFQINASEKLGLVGRNGLGKTTLFKIITGIEEYDAGSIIIPKKYRLGYVKQNLDFKKQNVLDEAALGLPEGHKHDVWIAEKTLAGLGFDNNLMSLNPQLLSGGFKVRLNLAKTLISEPNLLLLDEPTNYLDITSIRWLIDFLRNWKGELFLITHDRGFMDKVVSHTMVIHRQNIKKIKGDTEKLYLQIAKEEEIYEKQRINDEKKQKQMEKYITRFRAKARLAGLIQSRIKMLAKQEKLDKLENIKDLDFIFDYEPLKADTFMNVSNLAFYYENDKILLKNLSINIGKNDRIAVVGPNGRGKSTLLRILNGDLNPKSGNITKHNLLKTGYFGQTDRRQLHDENTIEKEIMLSGHDVTAQKARNICGALLFEENDALKKIKVLSGGEKSRVLLGKIIAKPINILILDEPTNHLDMESCDALLGAIDNFDGAVIIVTHNEMFLHAIAKRLIVFDGGEVNVFEGSYEEFLDKIGWLEEKIDIKDKENNNKLEYNKKELRKKRAKIIEEKSKILKPVEDKYHYLEKQINDMETKYKSLEEELIEASKKGNGLLIEEISKKIHSLENEINDSYNKLEPIMDEYEKLKDKYEEILADLNEN